MANSTDAVVYEAPATIRRMMSTTAALLYSLTPDQRAQGCFAMEDQRRFDWDFIPKPDRAGIPFADLDRHQRVLGHSLLQAGMSLNGYTKALSVMALENVLRELEVSRHGVIAGDFRNPDMYFFSFYGRPAFEDTWGWRLLGHHLCVSYTIVGEQFLSVTPCAIGAQPAVAGALSPLAEDEELGFAVLHGLPLELRELAVIHPVAPADYATRQVPLIGKVEYPDYVDLGIPSYRLTDADREALKFVRDEPKGVSAAQMSASQARKLLDLVHCYFDRTPEEVAIRHKARLEREGLESIYFCWAGGLEARQSHYYRVQTSNVLIEFDNAMDNGNHIHSVWRDYRNDLGHDLLLDHYEREHQHGSHLASRFNSSVPAE
jgi:hypothetical protein